MKKAAILILLATACNLFLAYDRKVTVKNEPKKKPSDNMPKTGMAAQNRKDLWQELETCYTRTEIHRLTTLLKFCVEDFDNPEELDRITEAVKLRNELIEMVDVLFDDTPPKFIDMMDRYERANFDSLHILQLYCKRHRAAFNNQEWKDLEDRYFLRMEQLMTVEIKP